MSVNYIFKQYNLHIIFNAYIEYYDTITDIISGVMSNPDSEREYIYVLFTNFRQKFMSK